MNGLPGNLSGIPMPPTMDGELMPSMGRFQTVAQVVSAYQTFWWADNSSSYNRARTEAQVNGDPPFSPANDKAMGTLGRTNVNWGLAWQSESSAEAPYNDLLETITNLGTIPLKKSFLDQNERDWIEPILAEEITRAIKNWELFDFLWQLNTMYFVRDGVSIVFFNDDRDWQWQVFSLQHFKFPRRVQPNSGRIDCCGCKVDMRPSELYQHIQNPDVAEENGWNTKMVRQAIMTHTIPKQIETYNWEQWETLFKNNDLAYSYSGANELIIETIHFWVRELNGKMSRYICLYDGEGDFLYKSVGKYEDASSVLVIFPYGVGPNGEMASIRGHANRVFNSVSAINRWMCAMMDRMIISSTPVLKSTGVNSEDAVQSIPYRHQGSVAFLDSGTEFADVKLPDFQNSMIPGFQLLMQFFTGASSSFSQQALVNPNDKTPRTKYEQQMRLSISSQGTTSGMRLFFPPWKKQFKQIVKRICRADYRADEPGGAEVWKLRARLAELGIKDPSTVLANVDFDAIEINTGLGRGSTADRMTMIDAMMENYYQLDPEGQYKLLRMRFETLGGPQIAAQLVPPKPGQRPPIDLQIADLEDKLIPLSNGGIPALPNQNHAVHLNSHIQELNRMGQALTSGQEPLESIIPKMEPLWQHCGGDPESLGQPTELPNHMQYMDPQSPDTKMAKQILQQIGEYIVNGRKHLDKMARQQGGDDEMTSGGAIVPGGSPQGGGGGPVPQSVLAEDIRAQEELRHDQQKWSLELQKGQLDLATRKAKAALEVQKAALANRGGLQ